jgi:hypothetical protein
MLKFDYFTTFITLLLKITCFGVEIIFILLEIIYFTAVIIFFIDVISHITCNFHLNLKHFHLESLSILLNPSIL